MHSGRVGSNSGVVRALLVRGMLAGLLAGLACFLVATVAGEPQVDDAIAVEEGAAAVPEHDHVGDEPAGHTHGEEALVSRDVQSTIGLFVATTVYGVALGGVFALVFAGVHRRVLPLSVRGTSLALGVAALFTLTLVPALKYPPNPPGVGDGETVGERTALWLALLLLSVASVVVAVSLGKQISREHGPWPGSILGVGALMLCVGLALWLLPDSPDAAPAGFPAELLWDFRLAALATQAALWIPLGLIFGALAAKVLEPSAVRTTSAQPVTART